MKIQLKRNANNSSTLPASANAGEPIWFKDRLYIGSVGATAGGTTGASAGDPIPVATSVSGQSELTLSTSAQTYLTVDGTTYSIKLPAGALSDHNQKVSSKNGSSAAVTFGEDDTVQMTSGDGISVVGSSTNKTITFSHTNSVAAGTNVGGNTDETPGYNSTFSVPYFSYDAQGHITGSGTKTVKIPASDNTDHNQTVKAGTTTFGSDDVVEIAAGSNITVTPNATNKTITIANTYSYTHPSEGGNTGSFGPSANASPAHGETFSVPYITVNSAGHVTAASTKTITLPAQYTHPSYTAHAATGGLSGTALTVPIVTVDGTGHVSDLSSSTVTFKTAPTSSNKVLTESDVTGIVGAMVYQGTIGTGGTITTLPTAASANKGYVYMVKTAGTYASKACEVGDMIVSNGTSWDVINGENQVTNEGATLSWGSSVKVATVDGTDIMVSLPANPNTNTWRNVQVNGTEKLGTGTSTGALNIKSGTTISVDWDTTSPAGVKINHAQPTGASAQSSIGGVSGNTITVPVISTDANGHVTGLTTGTWTYTAPSAPNDGTLTIKGQYTGSSGSTADSSGGSLFTANQSSGSTLTITGTGGIKTYRNTNTNAITVQHTNSVTAATSYKGSTTKVAKIQYDAQGHITACEEADIAFGNGALQIGGTATGFTANSSSAVNVKLSTSATTGNFAFNTTDGLTLTEIDGGTF